MAVCRKLLVLCLTIVVTRSLGAPTSSSANTRHRENGDTTRYHPLSDAVNIYAIGEEKSEEWDAFRIKNGIDSDSGNYVKSQSGGNSDNPAQGNKKNHHIFHQGINMDVSNMLDDIESLVVRLYRKIYGNPSADKWHSSRQLEGNPRHRVSTIVRELVMMFPQVEVRHKRSLLNQSQFTDTNVQNGSFSFSNNTLHLNGSDDQTFDETVEPFQFWFNLGSDVADFWRSSMYSLTRRILQTNITGEYLETLNEYLAPFKVHVGTRHQYKESNSALPSSNSTHRQLVARKKRYIDDDFSDYRFGKKHFSSDSSNRFFDFKDDSSDLSSSTRRGNRRLYYSEDGSEYSSPDRDDGYSSHNSYGGYGYTKLDPYVVLGALAACAFIGAMVLSLYCKMEGSPCCAADGVTGPEEPTTTTPMFDAGAIRTDNPFFFGLPPAKKKYDLPWV